MRDTARVIDNLGSRLKDLRLKAGLTLRETARKIGVSPSFVSQIENGKSQPSVATLYTFARLLDVSIDELFDPRSERARPARARRPSPDGDKPPRTNGDKHPRTNGDKHPRINGDKRQRTNGHRNPSNAW